MASRAGVLLTFVRYHRANHSKAWKDDIVRYGLIKYYPSNKDCVDPSITPSKVLMVHRVKPFKGNPWWEKDLLKTIGFEELKKEPVFVKNTPDMCAKLWRIKHLVKIVPVKLPDKLPDVNDLTQAYLHENGTFHVLRNIDPARYEATLKVQNSSKQLKYSTISEKLRLQWLKGGLV